MSMFDLEEQRRRLKELEDSAAQMQTLPVAPQYPQPQAPIQAPAAAAAVSNLNGYDDADIMKVLAERRQRREVMDRMQGDGSNPLAAALIGMAGGIGAAFQGKDAGDGASKSIRPMIDRANENRRLQALQEQQDLGSLVSLAKLRQENAEKKGQQNYAMEKQARSFQFQREMMPEKAKQQMLYLSAMSGDKKAQAELMAQLQAQRDQADRGFKETESDKSRRFQAEQKERDRQSALERIERQGQVKTKNQGEKEPKKSQFDAASFGKRVQEAEQIFDTLQKEGFDPTSPNAAAQRQFPGFLEGFKSEDSKRQQQAERNFINSILRRESGAAISDSEFKSGEIQYFPRIGDTPAVLAQKKQNRLQAQESLRAEAGPAWQRVGSVPLQSTQPAKPKVSREAAIQEARRRGLIK